MSSSRAAAKAFIDLTTTILVMPCVIFFHLGKFLVDGDSLFSGFSQFFSLIPGQAGNYLRKNFYIYTMSYCDRDCFIAFNTLFSQADTAIGKGVYIGPQCNIGRSRIDKNCLFGSGVHIISGKKQHSFTDLETPIREQGGHFEKINIGEDCWVGNGALIMANVGKQCIIGAGSVVTEDVEDYSIMAGNPAKLIKKRNINVAR